MTEQDTPDPAIEQPPPKRTITLTLDQDRQHVDVTFDASQFLTWDYVLAILEMARLKAEQSKRYAEMAQLQRQMREQAQVAHVRSVLAG